MGRLMGTVLRVVCAVMVAAGLAACGVGSGKPAGGATADVSPADVPPAGSDDFVVDYGKNCSANGYFARVVPDGEHWKIDSVDIKRLDRGQDTAEVLCVRRDFKLVEPAFTANHHWKENVGWFECSPVTQDLSGYGGCNSRLTSIDVIGSVGKNIFAAALTFGLASGSNRNIDTALIRRIVVETALFDRLRQQDIQTKVMIAAIDRDNQAALAAQAEDYNIGQLAKALEPLGIELEIAQAIYLKSVRGHIGGSRDFVDERQSQRVQFVTRTRWFEFAVKSKSTVEACSTLTVVIDQFSRDSNGKPVPPAERQIVLKLQVCEDSLRPTRIIRSVDRQVRSLLP